MLFQSIATLFSISLPLLYKTLRPHLVKIIRHLLYQYIQLLILYPLYADFNIEKFNNPRFFYSNVLICKMILVLAKYQIGIFTNSPVSSGGFIVLDYICILTPYPCFYSFSL